MGLLSWLLDRANQVADTVGNALPPRCPIPWRPHALAPVFSGYRAYSPTRSRVLAATQLGSNHELMDVGSPVPMRVWFPSVGGSPALNEILAPCGRYPLVVLAHGQNLVHDEASQAFHYQAWSETRMVRQLARAGYVVVVPQLGGVSPDMAIDEHILRRVITWMRSEWEHAPLLAPPPHTALIGHSRGAVHAARIAAEEQVCAYVSLGGDYDDWLSMDSTEFESVLSSMTQPKLFVWGTDEGMLGHSWEPLDEGEQPVGVPWDLVPRPKHRAILEGGKHYDYLPAGWEHDNDARGPCALTPDITADIITMFLAKYLSPPDAVAPNIPASLRVPREWQQELSTKQAFYTGAYLLGLTALMERADDSAGCSLTLAWDLDEMSGSLRIPAG